MDLGEKKKNAPTFDAVRARRNFIFSFDISDNCGGERERGRERGNLHNFQAHIKLQISCIFFFFFKRCEGKSPSSTESTFQSLHRALDFCGRSQRSGLARLIYIVQKWLAGLT